MVILLNLEYESISSCVSISVGLITDSVPCKISRLQPSITCSAVSIVQKGAKSSLPPCSVVGGKTRQATRHGVSTDTTDNTQACELIVTCSCISPVESTMGDNQPQQLISLRCTSIYIHSIYHQLLPYAGVSTCPT